MHDVKPPTTSLRAFIQKQMNVLPTESRRTNGTAGSSDAGTDPTKYHDPMTQGFSGPEGQSFMSHIRRKNGIRTFVIPRARHDGSSMGVDMNRKPDILIDPGFNGRGQLFKADSISPETANTIRAVVDETFDAESDQYVHLKDAQVRSMKAEAFFQLAGQLPRHLQDHELEPDPPENATPPARSSDNQAIASDKPATKLQYGLETLVTFAIADEEIPSAFTSVIRMEGASPGTGGLVLGAPCGSKAYFPKSKKPFAAYIDGAATVLQLESTGLKFPHTDEDLVIYLILAEVPM